MLHRYARYGVGLAMLLSGTAAVFAQQQDAVFADEFEPVSFRFTSLALRDPHVFVNFIGCQDITNSAIAGLSINGSLQTNMQGDADMDGLYDLSYLQRLYPLDVRDAASGDAALAAADCATATDACVANASVPAQSAYTSQTSGKCLATIPGTLRPYALPSPQPPVTEPLAPCFVTSTTDFTLNLGGIPVVLHDARIGATYTGDPPASLADGLLIGFLAKTDADATTVPATVPVFGGQTLSSLLPGGAGNCSSHSDTDVDNGVQGWYFYFNFTATRVRYRE